MAARKSPPKPLIALVVLLLIGGGVWYWWQGHHATDDSKDQLSGSVETTSYQVAAQTSGRVVEVKVAEGASVHQGDVLVRLDDATTKLQLTQAQEGVNAAKAQVRQLRNDDAASAEISAAEAKQRQAEAGVQLAQVQVDNTVIAAPHDGTVTTVSTNVGQNAGPGRTLLSLVDPADRFVRVYVPETRLGQVRFGQDADVTADSGHTYRGVVTMIATQPEFTPNNVQTREQRATLVYQVRVRINDDSGTLRQGLPVDVTLR